MKLVFTIVSILFINLVGFAQNSDIDIKNILDKVAKKYNEPNYSFNMKYELFKDNTDSTLEEYYTGKTIKKDNQYYSKIHNTETIQLTNAFLKINHDEKAILYSEEALAQTINPLANLSTLIVSFDETNVKQENDLYICEFKAKKISTLPYSKAILYISKIDYTIKKQILYLVSQANEKDKNEKGIVSNRLEISFTNFKNKNVNTSAIFSLKKYVSINKDGVKPSSSLKAYELINASKTKF